MARGLAPGYVERPAARAGRLALDQRQLVHQRLVAFEQVDLAFAHDEPGRHVRRDLVARAVGQCDVQFAPARIERAVDGLSHAFPVVLVGHREGRAELRHHLDEPLAHLRRLQRHARLGRHFFGEDDGVAPARDRPAVGLRLRVGHVLGAHAHDDNGGVVVHQAEVDANHDDVSDLDFAPNRLAALFQRCVVVDAHRAERQEPGAELAQKNIPLAAVFVLVGHAPNHFDEVRVIAYNVGRGLRDDRADRLLPILVEQLVQVAFFGPGRADDLLPAVPPAEPVEQAGLDAVVNVFVVDRVLARLEQAVLFEHVVQVIAAARADVARAGRLRDEPDGRAVHAGEDERLGRVVLGHPAQNAGPQARVRPNAAERVGHALNGLLLFGAVKAAIDLFAGRYLTRVQRRGVGLVDGVQRGADTAFARPNPDDLRERLERRLGGRAGEAEDARRVAQHRAAPVRVDRLRCPAVQAHPNELALPRLKAHAGLTLKPLFVAWRPDDRRPAARYGGGLHR